MRLLPNIGPRQKKILEYLEANGECTTQELVENDEVTRNAISQAIVALEERGLVESRPNPLNPKQKLRSLAGEP